MHATDPLELKFRSIVHGLKWDIFRVEMCIVVQLPPPYRRALSPFESPSPKASKKGTQKQGPPFSLDDFSPETLSPAGSCHSVRDAMTHFYIHEAQRYLDYSTLCG